MMMTDEETCLIKVDIKEHTQAAVWLGPTYAVLFLNLIMPSISNSNETNCQS